MIRLFIEKRSLLLAASLLLTSLSACAPHENVLLKIKKEKVAEFLVKAADAAQKEGKLPEIRKGKAPFYYKECMKGNKDKAVCNKLYEGMVNYAKTTDRFKSVTIADLSNDTFFDEIDDAYMRELSFIMPW